MRGRKMGNSLVELIPKIARMAAGEKEGPKKYYPRPSSAGPERCTRQMVYHRMGYEEEEGTARGGDDRKYLVFDSSSWHEELVADWISQSPFTLHSRQMHVDLGITIPGYSFPLGGDIDGIEGQVAVHPGESPHQAVGAVVGGTPVLDITRQVDDDVRVALGWDELELLEVGPEAVG